ncbi:hypothetical protein [Flammeovirga aprica]|uniref:Uncharacterized protein n=1 Tax=Flammeovirga aprica JL-4 TaxID=694437 RepID=A0A7X9RXN8_9BACT|nr:hypothetical protein [Flammeovirga aprica]NME70580.1 hypothetical protein [Flammeovirga aprica JL-4]
MKNDKFLKLILTVIAAGIWMIVLQNFNSFGTEQTVYVRGGQMSVNNTVDVNVDNAVNVRGTVNVGNTVDVNLDEVLGYPVGCRRSYTIDGKQYNSIDVNVR